MCWAWENLVEKTKIFILKNLTMPKTEKGDLLRFFKHPFCGKISKSWRRKSRKKKQKNDNFEQSQCRKIWNMTLWDFLNIHSVAKYQKIEEGFWGYWKFPEQSLAKPKWGRSLIVPKKVERATLLLWNARKEINAFAPVRTRNIWVEKQASYH